MSLELLVAVALAMALPGLSLWIADHGRRSAGRALGA